MLGGSEFCDMKRHSRDFIVCFNASIHVCDIETEMHGKEYFLSILHIILGKELQTQLLCRQQPYFPRLPQAPYVSTPLL